MFPANPIHDPVWLSSTPTVPATPSHDPTSIPQSQSIPNPKHTQKRKGTSLLGGLAQKLSRKKAAPAPPQVSNVEIWRATTAEHVHPNAARLGMNTFDFNIGSSRDAARKGRITERELSPSAVPGRSRSSSLSLYDKHNAPTRTSAKRTNDSDSENEDRRGGGGKHRPGCSAYSNVARERASGYVARNSNSSSSLERGTCYGSAQVAHLTAGYPRKIDTKVSRTSDSSVQSAISSTGSSVQRKGSSIFDRRSSRWDSTGTDITTPDINDCQSKSSCSGNGSQGFTIDRCAEAQYSSAIVEDPEELCLDLQDKNPFSTDAEYDSQDDDSRSPTLVEECSTIPQESLPSDLFPAPFVTSDLQVHQVRVQDFSAGTHEVHNSVDMAVDIIATYPQRHRKSIFIEMNDDEPWISIPPVESGTVTIDAQDNEAWQETLRNLSVSAVSGNARFYSRTDSQPAILPVVAEEQSESRAFGHKRSIGEETLPATTFEPCGAFPLYDQAIHNEGQQDIVEPSHRRNSAVLSRPKTIYVIPETGKQKISGSYEEEDDELDEAVAEDCGSEGRSASSSEFFDVGDGLERVREERIVEMV